jgi:hypothetical protein
MPRIDEASEGPYQHRYVVKMQPRRRFVKEKKGGSASGQGGTGRVRAVFFRPAVLTIFIPFCPFSGGRPGPVNVRFRQKTGKFETLSFPTAQGRKGLAEPQIVQSHLPQRFEFFQNPWEAGKKVAGLVYCHFKDIGDGFSPALFTSLS